MSLYSGAESYSTLGLRVTTVHDTSITNPNPHTNPDPINQCIGLIIAPYTV